MAPEQLLLAILGGIGFGFTVHLIGSTWQRLAVMLAMLYVFQTLTQQVFRYLTGQTPIDELVIVSELRLVFSVAAVVMLALLSRRFR